MARLPIEYFALLGGAQRNRLLSQHGGVGGVAVADLDGQLMRYVVNQAVNPIPLASLNGAELRTIAAALRIQYNGLPIIGLATAIAAHPPFQRPVLNLPPPLTLQAMAATMVVFAQHIWAGGGIPH